MTVVDKNMYIVLHLYLLSLMLFNIVKQSAAFQLTIRAGGWWVVAVLSPPPSLLQLAGRGSLDLSTATAAAELSTTLLPLLG